MEFNDVFASAMERRESPFPFQKEFAEAENLPALVRVPTGLGKTAMVVLGWVWRRLHAKEDTRKATPRRLVYCLPMRVLVEQTREHAEAWIKNLVDKKCLRESVPVHVLMGGEDEADWDLYPEQEAIIIGTQDMLLSRALNRGYAASSARWPMQFGLLNTDCLWVFDEIQLMGPGLATTSQLEAFRHLLGTKDGHNCRSVWMSATMQPDWLKTVDFEPFLKDTTELTFHFEKEISADGLHEKARKALEDRWNAKKPVACADAKMGDASNVAKEVLNAHKKGTRTIVVVNTVKRACAIFDVMSQGANPGKGERKKKAGSEEPRGVSGDALPELILLHSRFRPGDRKKAVDRMTANPDPNGPGTIVVSTQVIEAGVDVSATTLFTEIAPWASLVQRFGRCNRKGEADERAGVRWIDLPSKKPEEFALPYGLDELKSASERLRELQDVGLKSLPPVSLAFEHSHVIRRKDLIDLFDTTPDLAGNDIDIDRFIRDVEETDARVFWRTWDQPHKNDRPPADLPAAQRDELCSAPIGTKTNPGFRDFAEKHAGRVWRWNFLDERWERADTGRIAPGQVYLVHAEAGGYSSERGWNPASTEAVGPIVAPPGTKLEAPDATDDERLSHVGIWQTIAQHTDQVCDELECVLGSLQVPESDALRQGVRWHDRGKVHEVFVKALPDGPPPLAGHWAKARGTWKRYERPHFRHELASALAVLDPGNKSISNDLRDLIAYLVAAHHGKVRLSIRSLPKEATPRDENGHAQPVRRFARGVWDGDRLCETRLGGDVTAPATVLSLEPIGTGAV